MWNEINPKRNPDFKKELKRVKDYYYTLRVYTYIILYRCIIVHNTQQQQQQCKKKRKKM